jgi:hypothetical protein
MLRLSLKALFIFVGKLDIEFHIFYLFLKVAVLRAAPPIIARPAPAFKKLFGCAS